MNKTTIALILSALLPEAARAAAGNLSTVRGTANATVITPLVLTHAGGNQLNFGKFVAGSGGSVTVSPTSGAGSVSGAVTFVSGSTTADDEFYVTAQSYQMMNITTTGGTATSGGNAMSFSTTPMLSAGEIAAPQGTTGYFTVGGTLTVAASQPPGTYTGTYSVTVSYQ